MLKRTIYIVIYIFLFFTANVFADTIYLKNGNRVEGIITKETEDSVEIEINIGAKVTFSKGDIDVVEREAKDVHSELRESWEEERVRREEEKLSDERFREEALREGLVEYDGEWVTPQERERLQAMGIAKGLKKGVDKRFSYKKGDASKFSQKLVERGDWFVRETEHFSIFYQDIAQAKIVSDKAEYYFEKITYDLGYEDEIKWKKRCSVYIIESVDKWKRFLKDIGFNPDLVGGFVPNYDEREVFLCSLSDAYLALTFPHELTHLIFNDIARGSTIPLWLNEGLANYEASVTSVSNELLTRHIKKGTHILLGDLLRMAGYPEGKELRELFYAQSEKMVEFLIVQYGRKKFRVFCDLILKDKSFGDSLLRAYSGDFKDLEDFNIKLVEYIVK